MILSEYSGAYTAYSLRRLNNTNEPYPLVRVSREEESYSIECDVLADSNQIISFDSPVITETNSSAVTLGEFLNIQGYNNPDSLPQTSNAKIVKLYDQANDNDFAITSTNEAFLLVENSTILTINNKPAFRVNPTTGSTDLLKITPNEELSLHYVAKKITDDSYLGFESSSYYIAALTDSNEFEANPSLLLDINLISRGLEIADITDTSNIVFDSINSDTSLYTVEFKREVAGITNFDFADTGLFSEVILYPNYSNQRRYYIENDQAEYYSLASDNLLDTITPNSFINTFGTPAAAYSVRSLRGLTGVNGPKVLRVRRAYDNIEVDVYTDSSGWVSLDSPIENVYETTINTVNREYVSLATTLGEFVADPSYNNPDNITTTTATVSAWYDQSKVDTNLLPLQITNDEAAAAYSVRLVNPNYNGPLLRVRRTSDNVTKDIYPNDNGELDTDAIEQFIRDGVMGPDYTAEYLLDIIPDGQTEAPPAAAAYSLRKLRAGYTGPLVRVRRTDGIEVDVYPQEDGWFGLESPIENVVESPSEEGDFAGVLTFKYYAKNDNVTVVTWYDQSLNENDATQDQTNSQPKIYDAATGVVEDNGKPAVEFDGSGDNFVASSVSLTQAATATIVAKTNDADVNYFFDGDDATNRLTSFQNSTADGFSLFAGSILASSTKTTNQNLHFALFNGASSTYHLNGVSIASGNLGSNSADGITIGARYNVDGKELDGNMQELIFWDSDKSSNRARIEDNINNAFSIYGGWEATVETWYDQSKAYTPNTANLLDTTYGGDAAAAYSLRKLSNDTTSLVTVRREYDSLEATVEADSNGEISLLSPINNLSENEVRLLNKYPNAAAAYSLRRLNTAYTGNGIEAVGVDTSTNTQYGANLPIPFNTTGAININPFVQVLQIYYGQNSNVTELRVRTWYDQSGNGNDAVQTDVTKMPVIARVIDGTATLITDANGKPAVEFDGVDDYLDSSLTVSTTDIAVASVQKFNDVSGGQLSITISEGPSNLLYMLLNDNNNNWRLRYVAGSADVTADTNQNLISFFTTSSNGQFYKNGEALGPAFSLGAISSSDPVRIGAFSGGGSAASVNIQELVIYESDQSGNRGGIEAHINSFYNIYGITDTAATNLGEFVAATGFNNPDNITATSAKVVQWWDQSGNDNHALQYVSLSQPTLVDNGVLIKDNGKPAVDFDGTNDSLSAGSVDVSTMAIAVIASYDNTEAISRPFAVKGAGNSAKDTFAQAADFTLRYDGAFSANTLTPTLNTQYLRFSQRSTITQTDYVNSQSNVNDTQTLPNIEGVYSIGNAITLINCFNGKIQEAIAWESDQLSNRTDIESNINSHYRIYDYNDASQSDTNAQPTIANGGVVIRENGKPAVQFDGVDDEYILSLGGLSAFDNFIVRASSDPRSMWAYSGSDYAWAAQNGSTGTTLFTNYGLPSLYKNGQVLTLGTASDLYNDIQTGLVILLSDIGGNTTAWADYRIGNRSASSQQWQGFVFEMVFYSSDQSTNRPLIEKSINSYYNIYAQDAAIQNVSTSQPKIYDSSTGIVIENGKSAFVTNNSALWGGYLDSQIQNVFVTFRPFASASRWLLNLDSDNNNSITAEGVNGALALKNGEPYSGNYSSAALPQVLTTLYNVAAQTEPLVKIASRNVDQVISNPGQANWQEVIVYTSDQTERRIDIESNINSAFQIYAANFPSVLDTVPSAKAAYSIRRLTKEHINPIITLDNGSTTKDFYADFWGNLNADALTEFANGGTLSVTKWWDQSGNNYHLLGEYTNKPTLTVSNGDVSVNTTNKFTLPLLDRYSGAAAAYSLRELSSSYTGPLVRVRRDGTNTEVDVYPDANGQLSLDSTVSNVAESTTGVTVSESGTLATKLGEFVADEEYTNVDGLAGTVNAFVAVWYDQSNSNDASQIVSASQPKIYAAGTNLLLQSNSFDTTWSASGTLTSGQSGYDGTSSAWRFQNPSTTTPIYQFNTSSGVQTLSAYFKKNATYGVRLYAFGSSNANAFFNLNTGTVVNQTNTISASVEAVGSDWFRCSITFDQTNTGCYFYVTNNNTTQVLGEYTIQDAQLVPSDTVTEYIETTTFAISQGALITENGKPTVDFDGTNHFLHNASVITTQPTSMSVVGGYDSGSGFFLDGDSQGNRQAVFVNSFEYAIYAGVTLLSGVSVSAGLHAHIYSLFNGAVSEVYVNGTGVSSQNVGTSTLNGIYIGQRYAGDFRLDGQIQEIVIWNSNQTSAGNRSGIEENINDYYQISNFNTTASTAQTVAVYSDAINETFDLNTTYTDLKEIIIYE